MPEKPRQPGSIESDMLAWIEGEPLAPSARDRLDRLFASDPAVRAFAEGARADRDRLRALAGLDESRAPGGLVRAAFEQAERESLLGLSPRPTPTGPRRLRITPVRLAAGIAAVIVVGAGSLVGLIVTNPQPSPRNPSAPGADHLGAIAQSQPDSPAETPAPTIADAASASPVAEPISPPPPHAARATADTLTHDDSPLPALSVRLIRSAQAGPEGAVSPERAAELAIEGRLLVVVRASSPEAVERALLDAAPARDDLVRWRSILSPVGGAPAGSLHEHAPRVLLADVLATPAALEHVVATLTSPDAGTLGAWLQEIDERLQLRPEITDSDRAWWTRPAQTWAPRVAAPVLIEFARDDR